MMSYFHFGNKKEKKLIGKNDTMLLLHQRSIYYHIKIYFYEIVNYDFMIS